MSMAGLDWSGGKCWDVMMCKRDKAHSCVCPDPCLYALIQPKWHKAAATGGTGGDRLVPPNLFSGIVSSTAPLTMNGRAQMTQIGQAREVCGIDGRVCTVERGGGQKSKRLGVWEWGKNRWKWISGFQRARLLACMLRRARNLLPSQHLRIYFFAPLSML